MPRTTFYDEPTDFAWIITKDHLYPTAPDIFSDESGVIGPYQAPDDLVDFLTERYTNGKKSLKRPKSSKSVMRYTYRMYDDDGELYYTGVLVSYVPKTDDFPSDDALMAPLYDFGGPNAGAAVIKYESHPEWDIEY